MFQKRGRHGLVEKEQTELKVLQGFLPEPLIKGEIKPAIRTAIRQSGEQGCKILGRYRKSDPKHPRPTYCKRVNEPAGEIPLGSLMLDHSFC